MDPRVETGVRASGDSAQRPTRAAPARCGAGLERPPDPTPVPFVQRLDDAEVRWSVVEVDATAVPGAPGARCLLFTRQDCIRRVWSYPADWRTLDDAGLVALSRHR
jgi:hypothetical protein